MMFESDRRAFSFSVSADASLVMMSRRFFAFWWSLRSSLVVVPHPIERAALMAVDRAVSKLSSLVSTSSSISSVR